MGLTVLADEALRGLVLLAAAIAEGDPVEIGEYAGVALAAGTPTEAIDELLLQSVLTVGWPRALVAAGACRPVIGPAGRGAIDDLDYAGHEEWTARGERTCAIIYGDHYEKLRANVRQLHPALEAWMVTEGYGRTLSRPGLDLKARELCTVAQTAVMRTPRQLHSHLLGALRAGASPEEIGVTLDSVRVRLSEAEWNVASSLWQRVRDAAGAAS
jgi:4-carboxymuconolactone decarboxylase